MTEILRREKELVRVMHADLEGLKSIFPYIQCPFCENILFATPAAMIAAFGLNEEGNVEYECQPCYQSVGYDPKTGLVWKAAEDTRPPFPGCLISEIDSISGVEEVLLDTRPKKGLTTGH